MKQALVIYLSLSSIVGKTTVKELDIYSEQRGINPSAIKKAEGKNKTGIISRKITRN